jgi:hypothetical protein
MHFGMAFAVASLILPVVPLFFDRMGGVSQVRSTFNIATKIDEVLKPPGIRIAEVAVVFPNIVWKIEWTSFSLLMVPRLFGSWLFVIAKADCRRIEDKFRLNYKRHACR